MTVKLSGFLHWKRLTLSDLHERKHLFWEMKVLEWFWNFRPTQLKKKSALMTDWSKLSEYRSQCLSLTSSANRKFICLDAEARWYHFHTFLISIEKTWLGVKHHYFINCKDLHFPVEESTFKVWVWSFSYL